MGSLSLYFVAFIDIQKAFDTSWVEGTWDQLCPRPHVETSMPLLARHTVPSSPWFLFVSSMGRFRHCPRLGPLSATVQPACQWTVRRVAPGVQLFSSRALLVNFCADDLELMAVSQVALDAVACSEVAFHLWDSADQVRCSGVWPSTSYSPVFRHLASWSSSYPHGSDSTPVLDASRSTSCVTWETPLHPVRRVVQV